jgi:hypothetical protein
LKNRRALKLVGSLELTLSFEIECRFNSESTVLLLLFCKLVGATKVLNTELIPLENWVPLTSPPIYITAEDTAGLLILGGGVYPVDKLEFSRLMLMRI